MFNNGRVFLDGGIMQSGVINMYTNRCPIIVAVDQIHAHTKHDRHRLVASIRAQSCVLLGHVEESHRYEDVTDRSRQEGRLFVAVSA